MSKTHSHSHSHGHAHSHAGYWEGIVSIVINFALFVLKFWAGLATGSLALMADAWHTMSDSLSSVVVVIVAKFSSRKADKEHPFGHGRWEQIGALFIAFILGIIAFEFLKDAIAEFQNQTAVNFGTLAISVTVISIAAKELLAQYAFYLGRKTQNMSIKADGWHHRSDALSSVVVLAGILCAGKFWWIDSVLAGIIALMLFYATYEIIHETVAKLLGEIPNKELIKKITAEVKKVYPSKDLQLHHFHLHDYVSQKELTMHICVNKNLTILEGHEIATVIEQIVKNQFDMTATVHIEPLNTKHAPE